MPNPNPSPILSAPFTFLYHLCVINLLSIAPKMMNEVFEFLFDDDVTFFSTRYLAKNNNTANSAVNRNPAHHFQHRGRSKQAESSKGQGQHPPLQRTYQNVFYTDQV
jgi:hypothetical protein